MYIPTNRTSLFPVNSTSVAISRSSTSLTSSVTSSASTALVRISDVEGSLSAAEGNTKWWSEPVNTWTQNTWTSQPAWTSWAPSPTKSVSSKSWTSWAPSPTSWVAPTSTSTQTPDAKGSKINLGVLIIGLFFGGFLFCFIIYAMVKGKFKRWWRGNTGDNPEPREIWPEQRENPYRERYGQPAI